MKSKDQQLLEEAYTSINESVIQTIVNDLFRMNGGNDKDMLRYLVDLVGDMERSIPGVKKYLKGVNKEIWND